MKNKMESHSEKIDRMILELEGKRKMQEEDIKQEVRSLLQPSHLIKNTLVHTGDALKHHLGVTIAGVAAKRMIAGKKSGWFRKLLAHGVQYGVTRLLR